MQKCPSRSKFSRRSKFRWASTTMTMIDKSSKYMNKVEILQHENQPNLNLPSSTKFTSRHHWLYFILKCDGTTCNFNYPCKLSLRTFEKTPPACSSSVLVLVQHAYILATEFSTYTCVCMHIYYDIVEDANVHAGYYTSSHDHVNVCELMATILWQASRSVGYNFAAKLGPANDKCYGWRCPCKRPQVHDLLSQLGGGVHSHSIDEEQYYDADGNHYGSWQLHQLPLPLVAQVLWNSSL